MINNEKVGFRSTWATCLASVWFVLAMSTGAEAGLTGATINVSAYFPDLSSLYQDPGVAVVSDAVEYPTGSYSGYSSSWEVDVSDDQMIITDATGIGLPFQPGAFNGFVLEVLSGPRVSSASINLGSTIVPVSVSVDSAGKVVANFADVTVTDFGSAIIDIAVVPEPSASALASLGLLAICGLRKGFSKRP